MLGDAKPKKPAAKKSGMKSGHSPIPKGAGGDAMCGHSGCRPDCCNVRYVGHTSRISDHHMLHTARAVSNIWAAAIVVGLAVVLTGAIAFTSVQAKTDVQVAQARGAVRSDTAKITARLQAMERALADLKQLCLPETAKVTKPTTEKKNLPTKPESIQPTPKAPTTTESAPTNQ